MLLSLQSAMTAIRARAPPQLRLGELVASNSLKRGTVGVEGFILGEFYFNGVTDEHMK